MGASPCSRLLQKLEANKGGKRCGSGRGDQCKSLGFWVFLGLGFGSWVLGFRVLGLGFRVLGFGFRGLGFWVLGLGFWVLG